jgi:4-hydroxy-tetrahydrodipicolinate synthase
MEELMLVIKGLLAAVVTPFTKDGLSIDEPRLRTHVESLISQGVHGLVPGGSTGEFAAQSYDERRQLHEVVVEVAAGRVPVLPNVAAMTTVEAISLAKHAEKIGAAGVMAVAAYYEPLDLLETKRYFLDVAGAISIPVMVYNLPAATGVNLLPKDLVDIARQAPNVKYVKDTSGDFSQAAQLIHEFGNEVGVFVGWDTMYYATLAEGALGSVHGGANIVAPQMVKIFELISAKRNSEAKEVWDEIYPLMRFLTGGGYVTGVKGALEQLGRPVGDPRKPIAPLEGERKAELKQILSKINFA